MPKVSVIIPTYNRRELVQETINSVLGQSFADFELIVIDDGSTDGTGEALVARYGERIRYVWQQNQGESVARNHGVELAQGEYVALLDSDDLWLSDKLARQVPVLVADQGVVLVFCQSWLVDIGGHRLGDLPLGHDLKPEHFSLDQLCLRNAVAAGGSTALIRRSAIKQVGGFDASIHYGEDWDLWLRLRAISEFAFVPEPLALIRCHSGTQCYFPSAKTESHLVDHLRILEKLFSDRHSSAGFYDLRGKAVARCYLLAALDSCWFGQLANAHEYVREAARSYPELPRDTVYLRHMAVNHALNLAEIGGADEQFERYLPAVLEVTSHGAQDSARFRRTCQAEIAIGRAFQAYKQGKSKETRCQIADAMLHDPKWIANPGVAYILLVSLFGRESAEAVRRVRKDLFVRASGIRCRLWH